MLDRVSTFAGAFQRGFQINAMQAQLSQAVAEVGSGRKTDPEASMGTSAALLYQLQNQSDQQDGLQTSITVASQRLDTAQAALTSMSATLQTVTQAAQSIAIGESAGLPAVGSQATSAANQILNLLNTNFLGSGVFAGDSSSAQPMRATDAAGGLTAVTQNILSAATSAKGGALSKTDIAGLIDGANGLASVFNDTNSDPTQRYSGAVYTGSTNSQPTKVIIGTNQTQQYDGSANQPAMRDMFQGLAMLSMLNSPSAQLDDSAKAELLSRAGSLLAKAGHEMTTLQGNLGAVQQSLSAASDIQKSASDATQAQILNYVQADTYAKSTQISMLQTQLQATYSLTSQISQLSLVHFMPGG